MLLPQQGFGQACRRVLLHDAGCALGADNPLVQRVFRVAFDVTYLTITQRHPDTAAAGAHVTGGVLGLYPTEIAVTMFYGIQHVMPLDRLM